MNTLEIYRPVNIEFDVTPDGALPEILGFFENPEKMSEFLKNITVINSGITVNRHMDNYEKKELREEYNDILENILPHQEVVLAQATQEANSAKKKEKDCQEMVNAALTQTRSLAIEVKRGLKEIRLDELFTFKIPFKGKYYIYTWIDKKLKLCKIREMMDSEKTEIWSVMNKNEEFFTTSQVASKDVKEEISVEEFFSEEIIVSNSIETATDNPDNGQVKSQKGKKK